MVAATWPTDVTDCPAAHTLGFRDPVLRSAVDVGVAKTRLRSTRLLRTTQNEFRFTRAEHEAFLDFFYVDCVRGSYPFLWTAPFDTLQRTWRFVAPPTSDPADHSGVVFIVRCDFEEI